MIELGSRAMFVHDDSPFGYPRWVRGRVIDHTVEPNIRELFILTESMPERVVQLSADRVALADDGERMGPCD